VALHAPLLLVFVVHSELDRLAREYSWQVSDVLCFDEARKIWFSDRAPSKETAYGDAQWSSLDELLEDGWWTRIRNQVIENALRRYGVHRSIWDIGGGTGVVSMHLNRNGFMPIGIEPSPFAAALAAERGVETLAAELLELHLPTNGLNAVAMFDVLEHLDSRDQVLREILRVLKPGGHLVITVPALMALWSQHDVELGHRVRFNRRSLRRELTLNGFEVKKLGYFFALTVLPLLVLRSVPYRLGLKNVFGREATLTSSGGRLGEVLGRVELAIALRSPFGSSLLAVATKPKLKSDQK